MHNVTDKLLKKILFVFLNEEKVKGFVFLCKYATYLELWLSLLQMLEFVTEILNIGNDAGDIDFKGKITHH